MVKVKVLLKQMAVCEPPKALTKEIWVLTHPDLRRTAKVHAFMGFIKDEHRIKECVRKKA